MDMTKKEMIWFTIIDFLMLAVAIACVIMMEFSILSLCFGTYVAIVIFITTLGIFKQGKLYAKSVDEQ